MAAEKLIKLLGGFRASISREICAATPEKPVPVGTDGYRFLRAADLAASAAFFFWSALSAWACFWFDFFWLDFGDRSPIILVFFHGLITCGMSVSPKGCSSCRPGWSL
ncbi:MAG: hypothetical protein ABSC24_03365 [Verrucomicrobiota bacterium]